MQNRIEQSDQWIAVLVEALAMHSQYLDLSGGNWNAHSQVKVQHRILRIYQSGIDGIMQS